MGSCFKRNPRFETLYLILREYYCKCNNIYFLTLKVGLETTPKSGFKIEYSKWVVMSEKNINKHLLCLENINHKIISKRKFDILWRSKKNLRKFIENTINENIMI